MAKQCGWCNTGDHNLCAHGLVVVWTSPDSKTELRTVVTCDCAATHLT